jgi:hypothetical protein
MTSSRHSRIPFLPFPAATNSEGSTRFSSGYCSLLLQLLNSQFQFPNLISQSQSQSYFKQVKVTLRLAVSKSWCRTPSGAHDQIFFTLWQLGSFFYLAPSLTRGCVCLLYMLLALASVVFIRSDSLGTRDNILLSQIRDFPFRLLLRLAGSRWRYSIPPPPTILQTPVL